MIEKFEVDNKIGVMVSGGFGAGWSTWNNEYEEFFLFDKGLIELIMSDAPFEDIETYVHSKTSDDVYLGGYDGLYVDMIEKGRKFVVDEYDGSEGLRFEDEMHWHQT